MVKILIGCCFAKQMQIAMRVAIISTNVTPVFSTYREQIIRIISSLDRQRKFVHHAIDSKMPVFTLVRHVPAE